MGKVLVVRKTDRTVHVVPLGNKAILMGMNHRLPATHKMKLEVMEEADALKLPFIDPNYVSPAQAQDKLKAVEGELQEKDSQIAELEAKIAALMATQSKPKDEAKPSEKTVEKTETKTTEKGSKADAKADAKAK